MKCFALLGLTIAVVAADAATADAQRARPLRPGERIQLTRPSVHKKGVYGGVQPGKPVPKAYENKRPIKNPGRRKNRVTWVGFQPNDDGTARVFVQLTSMVGYTQRVEGDKLIVNLESAKFGASNARRFMDTRFFDTALARIDADRARRGGKRRGSGIDVVISFKNPADVSQGSASMSKSEADGYTYLFLDFGPPSGGAKRANPAEDGEGIRDAE